MRSQSPLGGPLASPTVRVLAVLPVLMLVMYAAVACAGSTRGSSTPVARPTQLSGLDPATLSLSRSAFCTRLQPAAARAAVGGAVTGHAAWRPGQQLPVSASVPGAGGISDEFGCSFTGATGSALAWVFGRQVSPAGAVAVLADRSGARGCATSSATFGNPGQRLSCTSALGSSLRLSGLFEHTWVSCQVTDSAATPAALQRRTNAWCAQVINALAGNQTP